jgi:hypothetical protein
MDGSEDGGEATARTFLSSEAANLRSLPSFSHRSPLGPTLRQGAKQLHESAIRRTWSKFKARRKKASVLQFGLCSRHFNEIDERLKVTNQRSEKWPKQT